MYSDLFKKDDTVSHQSHEFISLSTCIKNTSVILTQENPKTALIILRGGILISLLCFSSFKIYQNESMNILEREEFYN